MLEMMNNYDMDMVFPIFESITRWATGLTKNRMVNNNIAYYLFEFYMLSYSITDYTGHM